MQIQGLVDEYRKKTDEELLRLARDREQLTPEAASALADELARRKIAAERFKALSREEERQGRKEAFRSKRQRTRTAGRWWLRIQLFAAYAIGFLVYHLLPFKIPKEWEDAAVVTFLCTVAIGFMFHEFWKRLSFWVSLAIAALAQLWVIKVLNPTAHWHYKNASILTGFAVGQPLCLFGLGYSWVWWFKTERHQPGKRTGRAVTALVYSTLLPLLLIGLFPRCFVPRSYALIGLPFAALGLLLAQGKLRRPLAAYVLVCCLMFVVAIPTPLPRGGA